MCHLTDLKLDLLLETYFALCYLYMSGSLSNCSHHHDLMVCSCLCLPDDQWLPLLHYLDQVDLSLYMGSYSEIDRTWWH